jgi:hypothetical protein
MEFSRNLTGHLPSAEEIVQALGLQSRYHGSHDVLPSLALFGAGLLVGAGLALLFAPTTGRELREEISEKASELRGRATAGMESAQPHHA